MTKNIVFELEPIFNEIVERGREQGITEHEAFKDLVEEVLYEHESVGEIHDDTNLKNRVNALLDRFPEYLERLRD